MTTDQAQESLSRQDTDSAPFRRIMSSYPTGVTVLTASLGHEPIGMAANSFASVSLDPPLVLFCAARSSTTWPRIEVAGHFVVNILTEAAHDVATRFAMRDADRFAGLEYRAGVTGAPILELATSYLECEIETVLRAGDHDIVIGRVVALGEQAQKEPPLIFYRSSYRSLQSAEVH